MNPFELITDDEVIYQLCQQWSTSELVNMAKSYKRISIVCKDILKKKRVEYYFDLITRYHGGIHAEEKIFVNGKTLIHSLNLTPMTLIETSGLISEEENLLSKEINKEYIDKTQWLLESDTVLKKDDEGWYGERTKLEITKDEYKEIIEKLIENGFEISNIPFVK